MEALISTWGYAAVLAGTFLEGEVVLVLAGFLAHRGYLDLPLVIAAAFVGTGAGDQLYFYLGRRHGRHWLAKRPWLEDRADRVLAHLARNETLAILGFRFVYGLRTVSPIAIGIAGVSPRRFLLLELIGAAAWSVIFASAGYVSGAALEAILGDIRRVEMGIAATVAAVAALAWAVRRFRQRSVRKD